MEVTSNLDWHPILLDPTGKRGLKPRNKGITMVIDKGLGLNSFKDLLETSGTHIDMIKIGFGTSVLYPQPILKEKIKLAKAHDVIILPGGTFLEIAVSQNVVQSFYETVRSMGFTGIEVSDGTIEMSRELRNELILMGIGNEFTVISEYGKKSLGSKINIDELIETIDLDIEHGSKFVTIEGRESGIGVGIFNDRGDCEDQDIHKVMDRIHKPHKIMWETPLKSQQVRFIQALGPDLNLGNIPPDDIMSLESLRRGLRSDTIKV